MCYGHLSSNIRLNKPSQEPSIRIPEAASGIEVHRLQNGTHMSNRGLSAAKTSLIKMLYLFLSVLRFVPHSWCPLAHHRTPVRCGLPTARKFCTLGHVDSGNFETLLHWKGHTLFVFSECYLHVFARCEEQTEHRGLVRRGVPPPPVERKYVSGLNFNHVRRNTWRRIAGDLRKHRQQQNHKLRARISEVADVQQRTHFAVHKSNKAQHRTTRALFIKLTCFISCTDSIWGHLLDR